MKKITKICALSLLSFSAFSTEVTFEYNGGMDINKPVYNQADGHADFKIPGYEDQYNHNLYYTSLNSVIGAADYFTQHDVSFENVADLDMLTVADDLHASYARMFGDNFMIFGGKQGIYVNLVATAVIYNPARYDEILNKASSNLSFVDKIHFVKEFGRRLNDLYNVDRAANTNEIKDGPIGIDKLMQSIKDKDSELGGICGDITTLQIKFLQSLGINEAYYVTYKGFSSSKIYGSHAKAIAVNPDDPNQVISFNYGNVTAVDARGGVNVITSQAGIKDVGTVVFIRNGEGKVIDYQRNDVGTLLLKATNAEVEFFEDNTTKSSMVIGAKFSDQVKLNLISAKTTTGANIKGLGASFNYDTKYGPVEIHTEAGGAYFNISEDTLKENSMQRSMFYGRSTTRVSLVPSFIPVKVYAQYQLDGYHQFVDVPDLEIVNNQEGYGHNEVVIGASSEFNTSENSKVNMSYEVDVIQNRKETYGEKGLIAHRQVFKAKYTYTKDELDFFIENGVVSNKAGSSLFGNYGAKYKNYTTSFSHNNPLDKRPMFFTASQEKYKFSLKRQHSKKLSYRVGVEYNKDLNDYVFSSNLDYKIE